ncbi:Glycogenin-1 [Habropoda laboriosa]|uniref:glycogenin glucosyltransferase n=1 Tax=Habropoda laboriosa TaxID=597456 RepID=A0A0L7QSG5_9HYME|nr:Glycogenin-1 [Habropoda laboriosa]
MREKLSAVFSLVMEVNVLDSKDEANLALLARPELGITFTKLHCWRLTQYEKCVFLDADTLVVKNCDELFEREELSAAPDVGWPDCFNSGVFVYRPSQQTFASITAFAAANGSFDGGDQGLLNMYFSDWSRKYLSTHLPFIYNMCSTAAYSYLPAFKQFRDDVRIIHFIGITKPWLQYFDTLTGIVQPPMGSAHLQPLLQLWWNIFCEKVHSQLSPIMATSTLAPIWHEFSPIPYESPIPRSPVYTDIQDKTQNDIYLEPPDFTEFRDPWENYCVQNDPIIYKAEDNQPQQYYSTFNSSPSVSMLNDQFNYLKSVHQTHYETPAEHSREFYHKQHHNEYNSSSHVQHHHNQEQSNQFINKNEQQHLFFPSEDTSSSNIQTNHWQNQHSIENCIPVHSVQSHHSNESQHQYVDYQYTPQSSCNDSNRLVSGDIKQNQHVDYQHTPQHSLNDNNKSLSEETKQHQHNEPYINHQCNHYQMYDNVNNKQPTQHYEHENQSFHFNEQTEFKFKREESLNVNIDHNQTMQSNVAYQNDPPIKQSTEQNDNVNITDERTNALISTSPHPPSKPCTDIHNVATQSDPHITDDLNSSNGGLAGALAQMTLGEPRSAEQIALEEHMRKQSWEQGQIDYMGRDSFDNIWKKICETLALAPPRLPSPPKEIEKLEKTATDKTEEPVKSAESTQSLESIDEVDKGTAQATTSHTEEQSLVNNVPITNVPKLSEKNEQVINATSSTKRGEDDILQKFSTKSESELLDIFVDSSPTNFSIQTSNKEVAELYSSSLVKEVPPQQTAVPIVSSDIVQSCSIGEQKVISSTKEFESNIRNIEDLEITIDSQETKQLDIRDEKHAKELSTASEILTVSPVPIQVAESVLQVEPKESMSDSQVMSQEVLSSTITPVHLTEAEDKVHINSSTPSMQNKEILSLNNTSSVKSIDTANKLSESSTKTGDLSQILLPVEQTQPQLAESPILPLSISQYLRTSGEWAEKQITESVQQSKESESCMKDTVQPIGTSVQYEETKTSSSGQTPVRPSRTKELSTPSANVPKTAQQDTKSQEKATKKSVKKSTEKLGSEGEPTETTDGDSTGKKVTKKVVKKVTKKPKTKSEEGLDDGAEDSSSATKQKKTVKVVKKGTKPPQTPGTATAIPENPSSSTSDAPIPPKRKTKTTTAKTVTKKSDVEQ